MWRPSPRRTGIEARSVATRTNGPGRYAAFVDEAVGALATRGIAPWFSTFGGNPVACEAALAVLDVLEEEQLLPHTEGVGRRLRDGLASLMDRHEGIGDVRSLGLLAGVELVTDRDRREPAADAAERVLNLMREAGVLIGTTGRDGNVLKIRPPLVIAADEVDLLIEQLDAVLQRR
jgi:4-aminobutyrate aminotransferase-like enzyme